MEKISQREFKESLKDVRLAYRLLAVYQRRILDTVEYIINQMNRSSTSWDSQFSSAAKRGRKINFKNWSWDWLPMYMSIYKTDPVSFGDDDFYLHIIHVADSGYFDLGEDRKEVKEYTVEKFKDVSVSTTRLILVFSKNTNKDPNEVILKKENVDYSKERIYDSAEWLLNAYSLEKFYDQGTTDEVIESFKKQCNNHFKVKLFNDENQEDGVKQ